MDSPTEGGMAPLQGISKAIRALLMTHYFRPTSRDALLPQEHPCPYRLPRHDERLPVDGVHLRLLMRLALCSIRGDYRWLLIGIAGNSRGLWWPGYERVAGR